MASSSPQSRGFGRVETWVFDLDNTLYPATCKLFDQIDVRKITSGDFQVISYLKARDPALYKRLRQEAQSASSSSAAGKRARSR